MNTQTAVIPREHDEALAAMYDELAKARQQIDFNASTMLSLAKAEFYYRGRRRVTDMTIAEAVNRVAEALADLRRHAATHTGEDRWVGYAGLIAPYDQDRAAKALDGRVELIERVAEIRDSIGEHEQSYTGWSRFFLVTSSAGHVHSSMLCSSCRPTTTYGWLPNLSGKTEAEAVEALGATLCSVCFPSAPVEWQGGKITAARAAALAA